VCSPWASVRLGAPRMDWLGTKNQRVDNPASPSLSQFDVAPAGGVARSNGQTLGARAAGGGAVTLEVWQRYVEVERNRNRRVTVWSATIFLFVVLLLLTMFIVVGMFVVSNSNRAAQIADEVQTQAATYGAEVVGMSGRIGHMEERQREISSLVEDREDLRAREKQVLKFDLERFGKWVESNHARSLQTMAELEKRVRETESIAAARSRDLDAMQEKYRTLEDRLAAGGGVTTSGALPSTREMLVAALMPPARGFVPAALRQPELPVAAKAGDELPVAVPQSSNSLVSAAADGESFDVEEPRPPEGRSREISVVTFPNGDHYEGEFQGGLFGGWGAYVSRSGDRYEGYFKDDMRCGRGTLVCRSGERYVGEFRDDMKEGKGSLVLSTGDRYVGQFHSDMMNGRGTLLYHNGNKYTGDFRNGLKDGNGVFAFASGDVYKGEFRQDLREGRGTYQFSDGSSYIGEFNAGKRHGKGRYVFAGGGEYIGEFKDGKKSGVGVCIYPGGKRLSGLWQDDHFLQATPE
jgi:preprotein translocase subunit YajC